jgi:hypothetical protein
MFSSVRKSESGWTKPPVGRVGLLLLVERTFPRVLDGEARGDDHHLAQALLGPRLQDHPADRGVDRQAGEFAADRCQLPGKPRGGRRCVCCRVVRRPRLQGEGSDLLEQGSSRRGSPCSPAWLMNGKRSMSPRPKAFSRRMTSARLARWISGWVKRGAPGKSFSEYSRMQTPSATRPLRPLRWSALDCATGSIGRRRVRACGRVAAEPREAGVDDETDAGNGERGLGDIGRQHDFAPLARRRRRAAARRWTAGRKAARPRTGDRSGPPPSIRSRTSRMSRSLGRNTRMSPLGLSRDDAFDRLRRAVDVVQRLAAEADGGRPPCRVRRDPSA